MYLRADNMNPHTFYELDRFTGTYMYLSSKVNLTEELKFLIHSASTIYTHSYTLSKSQINPTKLRATFLSLYRDLLDTTLPISTCCHLSVRTHREQRNLIKTLKPSKCTAQRRQAARRCDA